MMLYNTSLDLKGWDCLFKKKDILLILIILLPAVVLFFISRQQPIPETVLSEAPMALFVTVGNTRYEPIPLTQEAEFTIRQQPTEDWNTIHITQNSIWMAASSCVNQDCVLQGVVSSDNIHERLMGGMIICLPNLVVLEMAPLDAFSEVQP